MDITKNDQTVQCEGEFDVNERAFACVFDDEEFDCVYLAGEATDWEEAVDSMTNFARNNRIILLQMTAHHELLDSVQEV